jgi:hypothetical protein
MTRDSCLVTSQLHPIIADGHKLCHTKSQKKSTPSQKHSFVITTLRTSFDLLYKIMATTKISVKTDAEAQHTTASLSENNENQGQNQKHIQVGKYDVNIDNDKLPLVGVAASAIVLIIAVGVGYVKKHIKEYGFTIGSVALIIALLGLIPNDAVGRYSLYLNYFLFIWCFVGACVMTGADGPFDETGNGYFASWALVVFSGISMGISNETLPVHIRNITNGMNLILGLGACAVVVMISTIPYFDNNHFYNIGESTLAVIVSVLTILLVANFVYAKYQNNLQMKQFELPTLAVVAFLWVITASLTTFRGPFTTTGNGYFACWAGVFCAVKATMNAKNNV